MNLMRPGARGAAQARPQILVSTPAPSPPPVPATMAQLPSVPPQVTYQNGMLTIVAENSTLGDILREVHRSTGAAIEVPPNATDRVVAQIGPGPARDVLASLLNGSAFNYVMLGSASDPSTLASVMLTMKPTGPPEPAANVYQPAQQQYVVNQPVMAPGQGPGGSVVQPAAGDDEADADEEDKDEDDSGNDDQSQNQAGNGVPNAQDGSQPNVGPKTPEQILEMLRQRQGQGVPGQPVPNPNQSSDDN